MAEGKKEAAVPVLDMEGLMETISGMGDDEMLTVEVVADAAVPGRSCDAAGKGGGHGK